MSQSSAQADVQQALAGDGPLTPEGSAKAQAKGDTTYIVIPSNLASHHGIQQSEDLMRYYDAVTKCLVIPLEEDLRRITE